jgi:pimeloyl-ACP methyl ester carboxylesterase
LAALACVSFVAVACSGGGGGDEADDPLAEAGNTGQLSVSIPATGARLGGTLAIPAGAKGPVPGVVIVPALGIADRNGIQNATMPDLVYEDLSKAFTDAGIATLRYDRRGVGSSKVEGSGFGYDDLVADAQAAVKFLMQRKEVGRSPVALVGHDVGGPMALSVAAVEPRVKSVVLLSSPGRPMVDVLADGFTASHGPASADRFRSTVASLVATGALPGPEAIAPEHQSVLGQGQDKLLKGLFTVDPVAEAAKVKVPLMVVVSTRSSTIGRADGENLVRAAGPAASLFVSEATPTLARYVPDRPAVAFDPNNEATHVGGARIVDAPVRDEGTVEKVTGFVSEKLA